ncbi:L,D-transpeptidase [Methylobacterium sp. J-076]|uniref:L,D-transpeptidase n=1 Tax=Methylobacterium sp. J-076 TaxID=2836655 RepID=UPI001FB8DEBE|nr:L,D-transpeptidase [Methylobacterium sp. J-076]MCJ2013954.1 L,D-transpeptidase [Methylobacterium sp. J-076]
MTSSWLRVPMILAVLALPGVAAAAEKDKDKDKDAPAKPLTEEVVNAETFPPQDADRTDKAAQPLTVKAQVLLDRARFSPGAIDGREGDNYHRAIAAFAAAKHLPTTDHLTKEVWDALQPGDQAAAVKGYTLTQADVDGPYVSRIPPKMEQQADLDAMGYTGAQEMLAERFHMSRDLLGALNPGQAFDKAGTTIAVAAVEPMGTDKITGKDLPQDPKVTRVTVDKTTRDVRAFGADGQLLAYYPASIGSTEKPAPSGETTVKGVAFDPVYTYNPKYGFKGVKTKRKFSIRPGPNNPVGLVWIDLAIPSYGIHGTPEPERVSKTESHGCIRLTNWSARDLAKHVTRGAKVAFKDE